MTFAFYELALNKDIQSRARKEIKQVLDRHGGELSYEAIMDMSYITQILNGNIDFSFGHVTISHYSCVLESLRKYSPVGNLKRLVSKDYHVPNTKFVLPKGTKILVPVHAVTKLTLKAVGIVLKIIFLLPRSTTILRTILILTNLNLIVFARNK